MTQVPSEEEKEMVRMVVDLRKDLFDFNLTGRSGKKGVPWTKIKETTENRIQLIEDTANKSGLSAEEMEKIMEDLEKAKIDLSEIDEKVKQQARKLYVARLMRDLNKNLKNIEERASITVKPN